MSTDLARLDIEVRVSGVPEAANRLRGVDSGLASGRRTTDELARALRLVAQAVAGLDRQAGAPGQSRLGARLRADAGAASGLQSTLSQLKMAIAGYIGMGTLFDIGRAGVDMASITSAFSAITGSAQGARAEIGYLRSEAQRLGLDFFALTSSFKGFSAAGKAAGMEAAQVRDIFTSVTEAATVLGLDAQRTERTLYALEQMLSKGTVSMEELRQQLGDQLPGAFQLGAKAMGVTTQEFAKLVETGKVASSEFLPKFATELRRAFGSGLVDAMQTPRAELQRLVNAIGLAKVEIGEAGFLTGLAEGARELTAALGTTEVQDSLRSLGEGLGSVTGTLAELASVALTTGFPAVKENMDKAAVAVLAFMAAKKALATQAGQTAIALAMGNASLLTERTLAHTSAQAIHNQAVARQQAALASLEKARAEYVEYEAAGRVIGITNQQVAAYQRLIAAERAVSAANVQVAATSNVLATAQARAALSAQTLSAVQAALLPTGRRLLAGLKGLLYAVGGPWVLGFTAAAAAVYYLSTRQSHAEQEAKKYNISLQGLNAQYDALAQKAQEAAKATDGFAQAQSRAEQDASSKRLAAAQKEVDSLRGMLASNSVSYATDMFGSIRGEKQYETSTIAAYYAEVKKIYQQFAQGELTAESAALALGDVRKELEKLSGGSWFDKTTGEASHLLEMVQLLEGGVGKLIAALARLDGLRISQPFASTDSQIAFADHRAAAEKARKETDKLYTSTKKATTATLEAAVAQAKNNHQLLQDAKSAAVLSDAQEKLAKHLKKGTGGESAVKVAENAISSLTSKIEALKAQLNDNKGQGFLVGLDKELKGYENKLSKVSESTKTKGQQLIAEARELGKQIVARQNLEVQADFWREYHKMTGMGLAQATAAHEQALQKQVEIYRNAGVETVSIEAWVAAKRLEYATDFASGARRAFTNYAKDAGNAAKNVETLVTNGFSNMEDAIVEFTRTGKLNFSSLVDSFIADFTRMAMRMAMFGNGNSGSGFGGLIGSLVGGIAGIIGGGGSVSYDSFNTGIGTVSSPNLNLATYHHTGGVAGVDAHRQALLPSALFDTARRYHSGGVAGRLASDEVAAVLRRGEPVFTEAQAAALAPLSTVQDALRNIVQDVLQSIGQAPGYSEIQPAALAPLSAIRDVLQATGYTQGGTPVVVQNLVQVHNNTSAKVETEESTDERGNTRMDIFIKELGKALGRDVENGTSPLGTSLERVYGLSRDKGLYY